MRRLMRGVQPANKESTKQEEEMALNARCVRSQSITNMRARLLKLIVLTVVRMREQRTRVPRVLENVYATLDTKTQD